MFLLYLSGRWNTRTRKSEGTCDKMSGNSDLNIYDPKHIVS